MLSIGKLGAGQHRYYLDKVAEGAEDYYSGEGEAEGYWLGDAAADLGLEGKVDADQLVAMLTGRNPLDGGLLGLKSAPNREPVPGFDLTFSVPKSVSLTWALGGHPVSGVVAEAHRAAVAEALGYLERQACWTRRGKGGHEFVPGNGFLAAAYAHRSSRAGDPQLHTHVLIANATLGPDGRWSRLYHPAIYEHAKTASYIYEAHLRFELTQRLGVQWQPVVKGIADIKGFSKEELRRFSTRRAEILEAAGEGASARAMQIATLETRQAKERDLTDESLREAWRIKGAEVGLDREAIGDRLGHERPGATMLTALAVERSVTAHVSHFDRREAIQAIADNLPHGASASEVEELADAFLASESVIRIAESPKGPRFTTQRIWALEQRALASAEQMQGAADRAVVDPIIVSRVLGARPSLKADQRAMVEQLLGGGRALEVVIGEAGTGKTYATVAAAEGWAAGSHDLFVAAPTWRAANVLRAEGLDATSIARLLVEFDRKADSGEAPMASDSVLLIDEAGMVDSATLARLIDHAQAAEAKFILIGDPAQLGEIEAGGLFAAIVNRAQPIYLDEVIRHRHDLDREAARLIREGQGADALARYRAGDRILVAADAEGRREAIVRDWWESRQAGEDSLMVAKLNRERAHLNARARELLKAEGRLGEQEIRVGASSVAVGDEVITRVNDHKAQIYNRERWQVQAVDAKAQTVELVGIDTARRVGVDSDYLERVSPTDGAPALEHAYAATIYQAQGATVDRAFVMADPSMDRQEFYVAASRSREETYFYVTPDRELERMEFAPGSFDVGNGLEQIARAAERDGAQAAAHDEALRAKLSPLSAEELHARSRELASEVRAEADNQRAWGSLQERSAENEARLDAIAERMGDLGEPPSRFARREVSSEYNREVARLQTSENMAREEAAKLEAKRAELAPTEHAARAETAVIEHLLGERERARLEAARLNPPDYITKELGPRPSDPAKRGHWDKAVRGIEGYRQEHGIRDRDNALGGKPKDRSAELAQQQARQSLQRLQRSLQIKQARTIEQSQGIEL
jgi:conjugative relaxase-like TrwC/TraI family protein